MDTVHTAGGQPLKGLTVIEGATFVAAPSAGLMLSQLGADVIRVDPPGGGSDIQRWPLAESGNSLFWASLNKGKRSVGVDYRTERGRELLIALITEWGSGIFVDNLVGKRRPTYEELKMKRTDVIHVHVKGRHDGRPAVDYTINAEVGVPLMTGPHNTEFPTNHVLPAWDLLTGMTAAMAVLAALHHRGRTGEGANVDLALADVALAGVGNMGWLAEADAAGHPRKRHGNHMFGSFGVDFDTADGRRVMVVALTEGHWRALRRVTETDDVFNALERVLNADLDLESDRYRLRETIAAVLTPWFRQRDFETVRKLLDQARVLWSPYLNMAEVAHTVRKDSESIAREINQPGIGPMLVTGRPLYWDGATTPPVPAPRLGEHTDQVLVDALRLSDAELGRLHADGVIGEPPADDAAGREAS